MRVAIVSFTSRGAALARAIRGHLSGEETAVFARHGDAAEGETALTVPIGQWAAERFGDSDALVFVGAAGIAVRAIAPQVAAKDADPAVLVVDERGSFVIPILSGHLGGANALARRIAGGIGAQPVITTATDVNGLFSVDDWAREQGFAVENVAMIKAISSALLSGGTVRLKADAKVSGAVQGVEFADAGELGVYVSPRTGQPFDRTLLLRPRVLTLGLGCKRGTSAEAIGEAADDFLKKAGYSPLSLAAVATIDLKADEAGLLEWCAHQGLPLTTHTAQGLNQAPGPFSESGFVRSVTGVDCVCERAAALHGQLVIQKTIYSGITLALSEAYWEAKL